MFNVSADLFQPLTAAVPLIRSAVLVLLLVMAAVIDVRTLRIPNRLTLSGAALGLALAAAGGWDAFLQGLGGLGAGFALLLPLYLLRVMGAGDVKLMAMAGSFLGFPDVLGATIFVFITGGAAALLFVMARKQLARALRNVSDVVVGLGLSVAAGLPLAGMAPSASVGKLPYGVSISLGTILYLAARQLGYL